ncbi:MAG: PilN domain-containing protein [Hyphomicrobiaceae bacterium]
MTFAAATIAVARLEHALTDVERVTAEFRIKVAAVTNERQRSETAERRTAELIALKTAEPHHASLIDRLSALLPDSDYLTALRIDGSEIELSGYSASTAALVPLIERSRIFAGAALTAPAVVDARNGKERFTLKATIVEAVRGTVSDSLQRGG